MLKLPLRQYVAALHRWLALLLAPVFLLILLSGAVLAVKPIADGLRPADPAPIDVEVLQRTLAKLDPDERSTAMEISTDDRQIRLRSGIGGPSGSFDLDTGAPVGDGGPIFDPFEFAKNLHKNLLIGAGPLVEIAAYAMLAIVVAGPLLAWPRRPKNLMTWHIGLGWSMLPLLLLPTLTAVLLVLHVGSPRLPPIPSADTPMSIARAVAAAAKEQDLTYLVGARRFRQGSVMLRTSEAGSESRYLVAGNGDVVQLKEGPGLVKELHEGTWAGAWSGLLSLAAALILLGLAGSGVYSWLRRRARRQLRNQPQMRVAPTVSNPR